MGAKDCCHTVEHAPFTLLPTPFPKRLFTQAKDVQKDFNLLVHQVSQNHEFLKEALQGTIEVDTFTAKIFEIYEKTRKEGLSQHTSLPVVGSFHWCAAKFVNEEWALLPPIPLALAALLLIFVSNSIGGDIGICAFYWIFRMDLTQVTKKSFLRTHQRQEYQQAWWMLGSFYGNESAVVMMVTSGGERNRFDQRWTQHLMRELFASCTILLHVWIRKSFSDIGQTGELKDDKTLIVDGHEIAVVYFRSGYDPADYHSEDYEEVLNRIRSTFTGLYTLDELILTDFVLKPQLEGGGNNIFGEDIVKTLTETVDLKERSKFILMDKIQPPIAKNYIVRAELDKPVFSRCAQ
ncbi:hypothetical protein OS493_005043 [Desmophyllum pertusum]|uniref:Glutathione synthetase n=1 Tax=Desmophyllum pertusum TaxID=174260 RepID=A0A9X0CT84_9CNID|nr:hypothetical protein OS493_005043 [Desmophyllum pertusum]